MGEVEVIYYIDPGSPWSWAAEPALRRLECEFAGQVSITYVLSAMAQEIDDPRRVLGEALEAAAASGMPIDARAWAGLQGRAPRSTYPACLAAKAAAEQGLHAPYLRVLLEGFWVRRAPLDAPAALEAAALEVPGLDQARFAIDLRSSAITEAFGADLERARAAGAVAPTFDVGGVRVTPAGLRDAVAAAGALPGPLPSVADVVARGGSPATAEVVAATGLPWPRAAQELWTLATELRVRAERVVGGELWHPS
jgi:predicted DsbA family dithiol-disulfide isomerase